VNLPLTLLQREKRRVRVIDVNDGIDGVLELFSPFLADANITVKTEYVDTSPRIRGRVASLEAILANLLTNSIAAFQRSDSIADAREVLIRTVESGERLLISVRDNGPGIRDIAHDDIWAPGQTTKPGGTGIGLTIVRDEAADLGGRVYLDSDGEEPGAEFVVELPLHRAT
jgi:C4-dicarboxylate-specific signal transduction histidine kinase